MTTTKLSTWFTYSRLRAIAFHTHRWLGLVAGILLPLWHLLGIVIALSLRFDWTCTISIVWDWSDHVVAAPKVKRIPSVVRVSSLWE